MHSIYFQNLLYSIENNLKKSGEVSCFALIVAKHTPYFFFKL